MKKIIISVILLLVLALSWSKLLDIKAQEYNIQTTKDVVTTLAITRSINAALSVVQNSSLLLGVGVQVDMAIGQVVNPINDFLDRFSWILLFALISLGIQNLIITIAQTPFINIMLSLSIITFIIFLFKNKYNKVLYTTVLFLIFIRFAVPIIDITNGYIYDTMMKQQIEKITKSNEKFNKELQKLLPNSQFSQHQIKLLDKQITLLKQEKDTILKQSLQNQTYFERLKAKINYNNSNISDTTKQKLINIDNKIKNIELKIDKLDLNPMDKIKLFIKKVEHNMDNFFTQSYTSIILFLARGVVFPLLFLWIIVRLVKNINIKEYNELFIKNG